MKKSVKNNWISVWKNYLIYEDVISYYAFFTMIFVECAYLWSNYPSSLAKKFMIILLAYVANVLISSFLKGLRENEKEEVVFSVLYVVFFIIIMIVGCFINIWMNLLLILIPLGISFLWIKIREMQHTKLCYQPSTLRMRIVKFITDLFNKSKLFYWSSQIFIIGFPYFLLVYYLATIEKLPLIFKVLIPIIYLIAMPYIAVIEDEFATCNIFQIAYDITWSKEYEEWNKNIENQLKKYYDQESEKQLEEKNYDD